MDAHRRAWIIFLTILLGVFIGYIIFHGIHIDIGSGNFHLEFWINPLFPPETVTNKN
jgi:hypothetical protein